MSWTFVFGVVWLRGNQSLGGNPKRLLVMDSLKCACSACWCFPNIGALNFMKVHPQNHQVAQGDLDVSSNITISPRNSACKNNHGFHLKSWTDVGCKVTNVNVLLIVLVSLSSAQIRGREQRLHTKGGWCLHDERVQPSALNC